MIQVNVHEAKTKLSQLLALVESGEDVVIARGGRPVARLLAIRHASPGRILGRDAGLFTVPDDFNAPLPDDVLEQFER